MQRLIRVSLTDALNVQVIEISKHSEFQQAGIREAKITKIGRTNIQRFPITFGEQGFQPGIGQSIAGGYSESLERWLLRGRFQQAVGNLQISRRQRDQVR